MLLQKRRSFVGIHLNFWNLEFHYYYDQVWFMLLSKWYSLKPKCNYNLTRRWDSEWVLLRHRDQMIKLPWKFMVQPQLPPNALLSMLGGKAYENKQEYESSLAYLRLCACSYIISLEHQMQQNVFGWIAFKAPFNYPPLDIIQ